MTTTMRATLRVLAAAFPLLAHHSILPFDGTHPTTLTGVVTKFEWLSPHTYIYMDVRNEKDNVERWAIESESPILLQRLGWTKDSMKPGDRITITGGRARNGARIVRCKVVELTGGRKLPCFPE